MPNLTQWLSKGKKLLLPQYYITVVGEFDGSANRHSAYRYSCFTFTRLNKVISCTRLEYFLPLLLQRPLLILETTVTGSSSTLPSMHAAPPSKNVFHHTHLI